MDSQVNSGFAFSRICIVQSLGKNDCRTGEELCRFLKNTHAADGHVAFTDLNTRAEFVEYLGKVRDELQTTGEIPVLHVEVHACPKGLQLGSGEFLEWFELKDILTEINVLSRLNLFVAMSACWGEWLVRMVRLTDRSPVWGCLGPSDKIYPDDIIKGFKTFYSLLLGGAGIRASIEAMGGGMPYEKRPFVLWPAQYFFLVAYRGYVDTECSNEAIARRVDWLLQRLALADDGQVKVTDEMQERIREGFEDHEPLFERHRATFFMEDLYPEHRHRFDVQYSTVAG